MCVVNFIHMFIFQIVLSSKCLVIFVQAYVQTVERLENDGADVGGLGMQSHLVGYPDITSIQVRMHFKNT